MTNREIVEAWFDRMWHQEDRGAIDDLATTDLVASGLGAHQRVGREGFAVFADLLLALITKMTVTIDSWVDDGDWGHCLITIRANCRKTDTPVVFTGQVRLRISDGQIAEGVNAIDFITLFEQLGQLPEDALGRLLAGERLGT